MDDPRPPANAPKKRRVNASPMIGIFMTVFLDLLSFGMVIPDLQLRGRELGAVGIRLGFTLGIFSLAQLLTSPWLGRLSDRVGRRKVLLITTLLSVASYTIYAHADSLWVMMVSRVLSGIAAANLGVAFAYVADITKPEDRAAGMGRVGAAFGLGFILGPVSGGLLLQFGHNSPLLLGYVSAGLAFVNFLYVVFFLPESLSEPKESENRFLHDFQTAFRTPGLSLVLAMFFALTLGFTNLESTLFQLIAAPNWIFHQGLHAKTTGSYMLGFVGLMSVVTQGFIVRRLSKKYSEVKLLRIAYLGYAPALFMVAFAPLWIPALLVVTVIAVCSGIAQPNLQSLISRYAPPTIQGGIFGITQALGAGARFIGPLVSNPLFEWRPYAPYLLGSLIVLFPAIAAWSLKSPPEQASGGEPAIVH